MFLSRIAATLGLGILTLLTFGLLKWFDIPAGNLIDWLVGLAIFYWLLVIVTIPWNIYFTAKEVIQEAKISNQKGIKVDNQSLDYTQKVKFYFLIIAITLHFISALILYFVAASGISNLGYFSSIAALLLTLLRPAISFYNYLLYTLNKIRQAIQYPREDIVTLVERVSLLETKLEQLQETLNTDLVHHLQILQNTKQDLNRTQALLEQLEAKNQVEHERLSLEAQQYMSQLTEDTQFLSHVKEIIHFWKSA